MLGGCFFWLLTVKHTPTHVCQVLWLGNKRSTCSTLFHPHSIINQHYPAGEETGYGPRWQSFSGAGPHFTPPTDTHVSSVSLKPENPAPTGRLTSGVGTFSLLRLFGHLQHHSLNVIHSIHIYVAMKKLLDLLNLESRLCLPWQGQTQWTYMAHKGVGGGWHSLPLQFR